ncbi:MAG TPA: hypothetical protein H9743_05300, partial [Candidatus Mediterraneibacter vanvlietii]|nr:hypothetical protein [Candidatus Mediterraneibacter vanvlietii]
NSFFILSRRIKRQDYENAEDFAKHLGNYRSQPSTLSPLQKGFRNGACFLLYRQGESSNNQPRENQGAVGKLYKW